MRPCSPSVTVAASGCGTSPIRRGPRRSVSLSHRAERAPWRSAVTAGCWRLRLCPTTPTPTSLTVWDVSDPAHPAVSGAAVADDAVRFGMDFAPDSTTLVLIADSGADRSAEVWDVGDPTRPTLAGIVPGGADPVTAVDLGPRGTLVTGTLSGSVTVWDATDRAAPRATQAPDRRDQRGRRGRGRPGPAIRRGLRRSGLVWDLAIAGEQPPVHRLAGHAGRSDSASPFRAVSGAPDQRVRRHGPPVGPARVEHRDAAERVAQMAADGRGQRNARLLRWHHQHRPRDRSDPPHRGRRPPCSTRRPGPKCSDCTRWTGCGGRRRDGRNNSRRRPPRRRRPLRSAPPGPGIERPGRPEFARGDGAAA